MTCEPASSASASPDKPRLVELMVVGRDKAAPNSRVQVMGGAVKAMPLRNHRGTAVSTSTDPSAGQHFPASNDPGQRVEALRTLGQQRSPEFETTLCSALHDPQVEVRATALEVLRDTGSAVPVERTTRLAREDGNAQLRMEAVALLADHAAWEALESALQDAEPTVREYAERLLEEVESQPNQTAN